MAISVGMILPIAAIVEAVVANPSSLTDFVSMMLGAVPVSKMKF
jgi:hypothetical protein